MHTMKLSMLTRLSLMSMNYKTKDITSSVEREKNDPSDNVILMRATDFGTSRSRM